MKRKSKVISAVLGLVMLVSLVVLPMSAGAVGDYEVKTTDTLAAIQTQVDAGNSLHFAAGTYSYTGTLTIGTGDIAIKTDSGASVTFNAAGQQTEAVINQTAPEGSVTFSGQGTVTLDGTNNAQGNYYARGIECAGSLSLTGGTLDISNFGGWGISGAQADGTFSMTGGELDITDCGWYDEGGFIWSDAGCSFTAGTLNLTDNGTVVAGSLVSQGTITFGSDAPDAQPMTAQLANYDSGADSITDTITAAGALTIHKSASVNIAVTGEPANPVAVNAAGTDVIIDGGALSVDNSQYNGTAPTTDVASDNLTITGGSVKIDDAYSIVNGLMVGSTDKVIPTPVNAAGEPLTRFDLKTSDDVKLIPIWGDSAGHPTYTYSVAQDHDGTEYVWAPAVTVSFWPSQADCTAKTNLIQTNYTIRGNTIGLVGGTLPRMVIPTGKMLSKWVDAKTGNAFDPAQGITENTDVYPVYTDAPSAVGDMIVAVKELTGKPLADGEFTLKLTPLKEDGDLKSAYKTATSDADAIEIKNGSSALLTDSGNIFFTLPGSTFSEEWYQKYGYDLKPGTQYRFHAEYRFLAEEVNTGETGVTYDKNMYMISIIFDNGQPKDTIAMKTSYDETTGRYSGSTSDAIFATDTMYPMVGNAESGFVPFKNSYSNPVTITYGVTPAGGGKLLSPEDDAILVTGYSKTINAGDTIGDRLPVPIPADGYVFVGWICDKDPSGTIYTNSNVDVLTSKKITEDTKVTAKFAKTNTGGGTGGITTNYTLTFEPNGGSAVAPITAQAGTVIPLTQTTTMSDYTFQGWYSDKSLTNRVTSVTLNNDMTVYAKWTKNSEGTVDWDKTDHFAYIIGYPDGNVHPESSITRAETATIFFRLMTDASRSACWSTTNTFTDVTADKWYNNAVSTMEKAGFVKGYSDGGFGGSRQITRAEFAVMAARANGADGVYSGTGKFTDVSGHWAEGYINQAAAMGLVAGYADGSFKPDAFITRAEAMTLVNRFLGRDKVNTASFITGMIEWPDNMDNAAWYYCAVQEATNSHDYTRQQDNFETWTKLMAVRDWAALERTWSTVNSGK